MKRVWLGVLSVIILGTLFDALVPNNSWLGSFLGSSGIGFLIIVTTGAFIARRNFLFPALLITLISWGVTVYVAHRIAATVESVSLGQVAANNMIGLLVYLSAAVVGAYLGMWFAKLWTARKTGLEA